MDSGASNRAYAYLWKWDETKFLDTATSEQAILPFLVIYEHGTSME
jgi:hypothetical protein